MSEPSIYLPFHHQYHYIEPDEDKKHNESDLSKKQSDILLKSFDQTKRMNSNPLDYVLSNLAAFNQLAAETRIRQDLNANSASSSSSNSEF